MNTNPLTQSILTIYGRLFVDLDGVLADFEGGYLQRFGHLCHSVSDNKMWATIRSTNDFFKMLPVTKHGLDAWAAMQEYNPIILTACPQHDYANIANQKHAWVRRNLPGNPLVLPCIRGVNKVRFMQDEGDILIDDFAKNLLPWTEAGGIGILHEGDWNDTLRNLKAIMRFKLAGSLKPNITPRRR